MVNRISLGRCSVIFDNNQPEYVRHAISELREYLRELTGSDVAIASSLDNKAYVVIVVGKESGQRVFGKALQLDGLGDEGFVIKTVMESGRQFILVTGAETHGTKFGLAHLMSLIHSDDNSAYILQDLDIRLVPQYRKRGIHLNGWSFNYPYTFRCWREQDWRSYIDLQTLEGVNLLYIWPFMEIMPVPLSKEDESYLEEVRRVIEYAQVQHGMEVWIMQAVNRVATDDCGVRDPRYRPYWRPSQPDLNPGDPAQFKKIAESHQTLYQILKNADGFCFIDCDPGGWQDSPPHELLNVLLNARRCLNRYSVKGANTKLVHWLWGSWGHMFAPMEKRLSVMRETLQLFKAELPEPWELICGIADYLPLCRDEGVLKKTIFLPYAIIEEEPSYPGINLDLNRIRSAFDAVDKYPEVKGVMANAQTPLLQFPHLYYWNMLAWDTSYSDRSDNDILQEVASKIYPSQSKLVASCFKAFVGLSSNEIKKLANKLERAIRDGRFVKVGIYGRKLFPDSLIVAKSLLLQLHLRAAHEAFLEASSLRCDKKKCAAVIADYLDAYLGWDQEHGWHGLWGYNPDRWPLGRLPEDPRFDSALKYLHELFQDKNLDAILDKIGDKLSAQYKSAYIAEAGVIPVKTFIARGHREEK